MSRTACTVLVALVLAITVIIVVCVLGDYWRDVKMAELGYEQGTVPWEQLAGMGEVETVIRIVFKPVKAPVVSREGLYAALFNGRELFRVRARNAPHAERKLLFLMERETKGKTLDFNLEQ